MKNTDTKSKIIEAGIELFSQKGYEATSVQDICEIAGVSKGAFFHYFPTKEAFFMEILDLWLKELSEKISGYTQQSENLYENLIRMTEIFKEIFKESHQKFYLFVEFFRVAGRDECIVKKLQDYFKNFTDYFTALIKDGIEKGIFKEVDPELVSAVLVSYAIGTIEQEILNPEKNWEETSKRGVEFIFNAIKKEV